jgi:hypothetical protein
MNNNEGIGKSFFNQKEDFVAERWRQGFEGYDIDHKNKDKKTQTRENLNDAKKWWDKLSLEEKENAFINVCNKIQQGDILKQNSYRKILKYDFEFDPNMHDVGILCGYMDIHNKLFGGTELEKMSSAKKIEIHRNREKTEIKLKDNQNISIKLLDDDKTISITIHDLETTYNRNP